MADFDPPFASLGGANRSPTTNEQSDGFLCGPADAELFNRLIGRIEAELRAIQNAGGIAGSEGDDTTVLKAIQALISAATGGGDTSNYVLFSQAQTRLPIFPEIVSADGRINITSPAAGTVRVPAGVTFVHRGIRTYVTAQTDLMTAASKTYHLRWSPTGGFVLKDLADVTYNATVAAEANVGFDTTYDDMLVARVVTNSSNVATITSLANKADLRMNLSDAVTPVSGANFSWAATYSAPLNWARTPMAVWNSDVYASSPATTFVQGGANHVLTETISRYAATHVVFTDWGGTVSSLLSTARALIIA